MNWMELAKALISPLATVFLAWAIGNRISARWAVRQKRRDEARAAANEFYRLYGEFFVVWKLWNYSLEGADKANSVAQRWELLKRAAAAEAVMEALLVKLTSERAIDGEDIEVLGRFRQGFQVLRQAIRDSKALDWWSSEHPEYSAFKTLASHVGRLVSTVDQGEPPTLAAAQLALVAVTSNTWEGHWHALPKSTTQGVQPSPAPRRPSRRG